MPHPKSAEGYDTFHITVPLSLAARIKQHLYSEAQGRVPWGAAKEFFTSLARDFFDGVAIDLAPYSRGKFPPGVYVVRGKAEAIEALKGLLEAPAPTKQGLTTESDASAPSA